MSTVQGVRMIGYKFSKLVTYSVTLLVTLRLLINYVFKYLSLKYMYVLCLKYE